MLSDELSNVELPILSSAPKLFLKHITPPLPWRGVWGVRLGLGVRLGITESLPSYAFAMRVASGDAA